ncbi:MAG: ABC transporter permease [Gemmobacter sp.]
MTRVEGRANLVLIWAVAVAGLLLIYAPPFYLMAISLNPALQPGLPSLSDLSLRWCAGLAQERGLIAALRLSVAVATLTAVLATALALLAALAYQELRSGRSAWFLTVLLPMFVPGVIQGLALSVIFTRLGVRPSVATVTAGHLLWAMPFAFVAILTSMRYVRRSWLMAAVRGRDAAADPARSGQRVPVRIPAVAERFCPRLLSGRTPEHPAHRDVRAHERRHQPHDLCAVRGDPGGVDPLRGPGADAAGGAGGAGGVTEPAP